MTRIKFLCLIVWLCSALSLQGQTLSEGFTAQTIPDSIWQHMQGRSYQPNPHIQRADLRYLRVLHYDYDGRTHQGELVCNKRIASKLLTIFRELYEARYPIQRITLSDNYDADDELLLLSCCVRHQTSVEACLRLSHRHQSPLQPLRSL